MNSGRWSLLRLDRYAQSAPESVSDSQSVLKQPVDTINPLQRVWCISHRFPTGCRNDDQRLKSEMAKPLFTLHFSLFTVHWSLFTVHYPFPPTLPPSATIVGALGWLVCAGDAIRLRQSSAAMSRDRAVRWLVAFMVNGSPCFVTRDSSSCGDLPARGRHAWTPQRES